MALPTIADLKLWVGTLFTKDDWDFNFKKIVGWLSDGSSDLIFNSAKISNGIDLDGSTITNMGIATTGTQPITLDQAQTLLNKSSNLIPFSIASGKVGASGTSDYLQKNSDTQVTVLAGNVNPDLVVVQSDGTVESITSNTVLTVPTTDDTYFIVKEKGQTPVITAGNIAISAIAPSSAVAGDYWLNNSVEPLKGYKYDSLAGWQIQEFCLIGVVIVSGGVTTVKQRGYNTEKEVIHLEGTTPTLINNKEHEITITGNTTFTLPTVTSPDFNQILVLVYMPTAYTLNLGTSKYFYNSTPDMSQTGKYTLIYEYDGSNWVVGAMYKGA